MNDYGTWGYVSSVFASLMVLTDVVPRGVFLRRKYLNSTAEIPPRSVVATFEPWNDAKTAYRNLQVRRWAFRSGEIFILEKIF